MGNRYKMIKAKRTRVCYLCDELIDFGEDCVGIKSNYDRWAGCHIKHFSKEFLDKIMVDNL